VAGFHTSLVLRLNSFALKPKFQQRPRNLKLDFQILQVEQKPVTLWTKLSGQNGCQYLLTHSGKQCFFRRSKDLTIPYASVALCGLFWIAELAI